MSENKETHQRIPYIQAGGDCLGTGWGCENAITQMGLACMVTTLGSGAGQKPMCKSIDEIKIMREAQA